MYEYDNTYTYKNNTKFCHILRTHHLDPPSVIPPFFVPLSAYAHHSWGPAGPIRIVYMGGLLSWQFTILANNNIFLKNEYVLHKCWQYMHFPNIYSIFCQDSTPPIQIVEVTAAQ